jgi:lysophospholipase L1-like esterase
MRQPRARDHVEFAEIYNRAIGLLRANARCVLAVSPLFIGEDLANPWNRELDRLGGLIKTLVRPLSGVGYVDLRACLSRRLPPSTQASSFLPRSVTAIVCEALLLRTSAQVDRVAARRGLHLTLDGVHLNSTGAEAVAEALRRALQLHL